MVSNRSRSNGYCGSLSKIAEARRIACGPKRAPGRFETAASNGMPQTTASAPRRFLVNLRRMKDSAPAWVGSLAAPVSPRAVKAWSIDFDGMALSSGSPDGTYRILPQCCHRETPVVRRPVRRARPSSLQRALGDRPPPVVGKIAHAWRGSAASGMRRSSPRCSSVFMLMLSAIQSSSSSRVRTTTALALSRCASVIRLSCSRNICARVHLADGWSMSATFAEELVGVIDRTGRAARETPAGRHSRCAAAPARRRLSSSRRDRPSGAGSASTASTTSSVLPSEFGLPPASMSANWFHGRQESMKRSKTKRGGHGHPAESDSFRRMPQSCMPIHSCLPSRGQLLRCRKMSNAGKSAPQKKPGLDGRASRIFGG